MSLCQPELSLDAQSLNARLTRLEDQIKSGSFVAAAPIAVEAAVIEEERPPMPDDYDAPPPPEEEPPRTPTPVGFWTDLAAAIRQELKPPLLGFFSSSPNAPIQGLLEGDQVVLSCSTGFIQQMVDKPAVLELVARKASAQLGRPVRVKTVDRSAGPVSNQNMEQLLSFGRAHSDIIKIKE